MRLRNVIITATLILLYGPATFAAERDGLTVRDAVRLYRVQNEVRILTELAELVSLPNVAANLDDMEINAARLVTMLASRSFETRLLRADGAPPAVFGQRLRDDRAAVIAVE